MKNSRERQETRQHRFEIVVERTGDLVPTGKTYAVQSEPIPIRPKKPDPDWFTLSATGFRMLARLVDLERAHADPSQAARSLTEQVQSRIAGTALHYIKESVTLFHELQYPGAKTAAEAWEKYQEALTTRLPELLPTTPPGELRHLRHTLEDPRFALTALEQRSGTITNREEMIADQVIRDVSEKPPLTGTFPFPTIDPTVEMPPFLDPEEQDREWVSVTAPKLRERTKNLLAWQRQHRLLGRALSRPKENNFFGLPEMSALVIAPGLELSLFARLDEATHFTGSGGNVHIEITDLKSSTKIHRPQPGSAEEVAEEAITYLTTVATARPLRVEQKKPGYALTYYTDVGPDVPRTLSPGDQVHVRFVALGHYPPDTVDFAETYRDALFDPMMAQAMLSQAQELLDEIRYNPDLRSLVRTKKTLP